ncbi:Plastid lipid-associated protein/fibrillin conserved domain [Dillenia turbinata]|uniref:Plastid lipid-associated protein/fibrillin conserved domain n=1 Tax=Dillenia turbinata TaxID=194707 RepID=A0AAN8V3L8_9MAGN
MSIVLILPASSSFLSPLSNFKPPNPNPKIPKPYRITTTCSAITDKSQPLNLAKSDLLNLISDQDRGLKTQQNPNKLSQIVKSIEAIAELGKDLVTTNKSLSATWRLLWTTEKEQLFIIKNASFFGTQAGDVLQVIDVENRSLNNVITFPPDGVFFVRSTIEIASSQRVNFRFTSAVLRGKDWELSLPPFGQGWFETLYLDDEIRVVKDIREDYLVVERAPYNWKE